MLMNRIVNINIYILEELQSETILNGSSSMSLMNSTEISITHTQRQNETENKKE